MIPKEARKSKIRPEKLKSLEAVPKFQFFEQDHLSNE
jgi:hypothetical protein